MDLSFFMATYYMHFPFLTCEVKCGATALDIADRQNAHSMTLSVDRWKTAFVTPHGGRQQLTVSSMGLTSSPGFFQNMMEAIWLTQNIGFFPFMESPPSWCLTPMSTTVALTSDTNLSTIALVGEATPQLSGSFKSYEQRMQHEARGQQEVPLNAVDELEAILQRYDALSASVEAEEAPPPQPNPCWTLATIPSSIHSKGSLRA
ncbi:hypothetical protein GX51_03757 [Blastomyces parvus]|uniref:DUF7924 domain-containing protein n=1 Tax=Blastomyces parvus TaxID=2060905 RepID=A0A2B7X567_9EURO|nr:hypothetical protein GX51_03757 [Blastomyces parvus]